MRRLFPYPDASWQHEVRAWLSAFVVEQACLARDRLGFSWEARDDAPDTYDKLTLAFTESVLTGEPLPVATVNVTPSIFLSTEANYAMRFWHDVTHVGMNADFGFLDEMKVAKAHLAALCDAGMPEGSRAWQMLRADTVGQNYVYVMTGGGFVPDQLAFAYRAMAVNLPFAVLEVVQQIGGHRITGRDTEMLLKFMEADQ